MYNLKTHLLIFLISLTSCRSSVNENFSKENQRLKSEYKKQWESFARGHMNELSEEEMLDSLDSISEKYLITKNKELAARFAQGDSGLKRLNFLKVHFSKEELAEIINKVPQKLRADSNYKAIKTYVTSR